MADLWVRGLDEELVKALQREAAAHGRSTEAELQAIPQGMVVTRNVKDFVEPVRLTPSLRNTHIRRTPHQ
jgi:plasmid stability protein